MRTKVKRTQSYGGQRAQQDSPLPVLTAIAARLADIQNSSPRYKDMLYLQNRADAQVTTATTAVNRVGQLSERVNKLLSKLEVLCESIANSSSDGSPSTDCEASPRQPAKPPQLAEIQKTLGSIASAVSLIEEATLRNYRQTAKLDEKIELALCALQSMMDMRNDLDALRADVSSMTASLKAIEHAASSGSET